MDRAAANRTVILALAIVAAAASAPAKSPPPADAVPNFAEHVAPIVFRECTVCHRDGEAAPFELIDYRSVRRRARLIRDVVNERFMPPWHAAEAFGEFKNKRRLTDEEIATLTAWVDGGMPEGDPALAPPLPQFPDGWQLGEPDVVLTMENDFTVPASGRDIYRYFTLPLALPEDKWVRAIEVRPSARSVVHHILFFLDDAGRARELDAADEKPGFSGRRFDASGDLGGWAVGTQPHFFGEGLALPLPKGSDLVLQTHFHPVGKEETERTSIGLFLTDEPPAERLFTFQVPPDYGRMEGIDIPPGEANFVIEDSFTLPAAVDLLTVWGHAHMTCREMKGEAVLPDGSIQPLLHIPRWNFNWQTIYQYRDRVHLPAGTRIDVRIVYDNSADNPSNPFNPPQRIRWGEQSTDEMGSLIFRAAPVSLDSAPALAAGFHAQRRMAFLKATARELGPDQFAAALARIRASDADRDGRIVPDEIDEDWRRKVFRSLDHDDNDVIDAEELARADRAAEIVFNKGDDKQG